MPRTHLALAALLVAVPLAGCISGPGSDGGPPASLEPEPVTQGRDSFIENETTVIAHNQTQWEDRLQRVWDTYHEPSEEMPPVPSVNFSGSMAIAYFAGEIEDRCAGVQIGDLTAPNGTNRTDEGASWEATVTVFTVENETTDCRSSSPIQMVLFPQVAGEITLETEATTLDEAPPGWAEHFQEQGSEASEDHEISERNSSASEG